MKLRLALLALVAALALAACGGSPVAPAAPAPTEPAPAAAAPVEITYMMWGSPEELAVWEQIVADFEAANPGITVKVDVSDWDSYWSRLKTLYAGGTPPDVFAMDGPLYPDWQSRGVLLNLQPYIDKSPELLDGIYPATLSTYQRDGAYYGLPRDFQTITLFYNKDMFDAAGLADGPARDAWQLLADMVLVDKSLPDPVVSAEYGSDPVCRRGGRDDDDRPLGCTRVRAARLRLGRRSDASRPGWSRHQREQRRSSATWRRPRSRLG